MAKCFAENKNLLMVFVSIRIKIIIALANGPHDQVNFKHNKSINTVEQ